MDLLIPLDSQLKKPLYEQIYAHIRKEIREGNFRMGERLPSTRTLATHLKVSRSTTQMAYDQLLAEGYIEARPYRGIYVAQMEELVEVETPVCVEEGTDGFLEARESKEEKNLVDFSPRKMYRSGKLSV